MTWLEQLLSTMQRSSDDSSLKVACCASISHLITRLPGFPELKRDWTARAGRLVELLLKIFNEDNPHTVQESAVHLLSAIITSSSLPSYYDIVEKATVSKLFSGNDNPNLRKKFATTLALLPNFNRGKDNWLPLLKSILLLLNGLLTDIFSGFEDGCKLDEAMRLLVPEGVDKPKEIWGQKLVEDVSGKGKRMAKLHTALLLMSSCLTMLTNSYPIQVKLPVLALLALVDRVLTVHGSLPNVKSFVIAAEQEYVCSELPVLHSYGLDLLSSVIECLRGQLLRHAAHIFQLVKGMGIYFGQVVVSNALIDLNDVAVHTIDMSSNASSEAYGRPSQSQGASNSVKKAALEAIKALITVGGALCSEPWRSTIDNLVINIAKKSCIGKLGDERSLLSNDHPSMLSDLQFAALDALLASLLSPSRTRPPHLAQSLELFSRGRREAGMKISEFCTHALLALEVLMHPRALPFIDSSLNPSTPFSRGNHEVELGGDLFDRRNNDVLHQSWIVDTKETEDSLEIVRKQMDMEGESACETAIVDQSGEKTCVGNPEVQMNDEAVIMVGLGQPSETYMMRQTDMDEETDQDIARVVEQSGTRTCVANDDAEAEVTDEAAMMVDMGGLVSPKRMDFGAESDSESTHSWPDIVRARPDPY
ncbi:unnamed protein product [Linum tenue]|uniref:Pre-rRNA-processing protein RIX1 N-terminal domain-containing protein n=1 Tax=Linum tenue TaxID=586396 RepID=A0AAV0RQE0_9ROSI|nr:unnamed protein product [Linum tenue]